MGSRGSNPPLRRTFAGAWMALSPVCGGNPDAGLRTRPGSPQQTASLVHPWSTLRARRCASDGGEIAGRSLARALVGDSLEAYLLALIEAAHAGALNRADVNEDIGAPAPLHSTSCRHFHFLARKWRLSRRREAQEFSPIEVRKTVVGDLRRTQRRNPSHSAKTSTRSYLLQLGLFQVPLGFRRNRRAFGSGDETNPSLGAASRREAML